MITGANFKGLILVCIYLIFSFAIKNLLPSLFSPPGCSPSSFAFSSPKHFGDRLLFILVVPAILLEPVALDLKNIFQLNTLRLQSGNINWNNLIRSSRTYTCIYSMHGYFHGQRLFVQSSQEHNLWEKISNVKLIATQARLKVVDYDSIEDEIQQVNELIPKLEKLKSDFDVTCNTILSSKDPAAKHHTNLLNAALAFYGTDDNLPEAFKKIKNIPNRYRTLDVDPQDPSSVILSEEFKEALVKLGVDPQKLLNISVDIYNSKFQSLLKTISSKAYPKAILMAIDYIKSLRYFQDLALKDVSEKVEEKVATGCSTEDVYKYWSIYSAKYLDEFMITPLSSVNSKEDILKFIALRLEQEEIDPKLFSRPVNYALLNQWADIDEHKTFSSLHIGIPHLPTHLQTNNPYSLKAEIPSKQFDPRNALASEDVVKEPWILGTSGQLGVRLFTPINPTFFVILSPPATHEINPSAGIKDIEVWGQSIDGRHIHLSSFTRPKVSSGYDQIEVNEFSDKNIFFNSFQLVIKSNHGHLEYSKLYQFIVHGTPANI